MNTFFSVELIAGVLSGLVIATVVMLVLQIRNSVQINKLTFPAYEYVVKQAEHKANEIITAAQKDARSIITAAEQSGQKVFGQHNEAAVKIHETYSETLQKLVAQLTEQLAATATEGSEQLATLTLKATQTLSSHEEDLAKQFNHSLNSIEKMTATLQSQTGDALTHLKAEIESVRTALTDTLVAEDEKQKERIQQQLEKALTSAQVQIDEYQKARMTLLDTHIEQLVEDITARVLHKKLTNMEHAELAREALAEAKAHHII